jgi:hypothetical protein
MKIASAIQVLILTVIIACTAAAGEEAPVRKVLPADIFQKYESYIESYKARHIDRGGTVEAILDDETKSRVVRYYGHGDSQGWTGLTMSGFAFQGDWDLVRTNLSYWPLLEIEPGKYKRFPEHPADDPDPTSIDQYGEMIMGIAAVWLLGPDDLKREVAHITKDIIVYGNAHEWRMGKGPYVDCNDIRFLFQLLSMKMGLGIDTYLPGEDFDDARDRFYLQFKKAVLVRQTPRYYTLNLFFERMFVAKLLYPDLPGLDAEIRDWYKVVRKDDDTMFDWFAARVAGKDTSFVESELRAFPPNPPNDWENNGGYNVGYRWERSPEQKAEPPSGASVERSGMDFFVLASYYSYFKLHDFGK